MPQFAYRARRNPLSKNQPVAEAPVVRIEPPAPVSADAARREVLKRIGVYGAFITPALLTAFSSSASAQAVIESGATN
jgi:hypothetical protein